MPNDCWNVLTIKAENEQIRAILTREFTDVPAWAFKLLQVGEEMLVVKVWSRWAPDKDRMDRLYNNYDDIWIKNEWNEEGGYAGVIVGKRNDRQELSWDEGCIEEWGHRSRAAEQMPAPVLCADTNHDECPLDE